MPVDLSQILYILMSLAAVVLWFRVIVSRKPPLEARPRIQSPLGLYDVGILFGCWIISQANSLGALVVVMKVPSESLGNLNPEQELTLMGFSALFQLIWTAIGLLMIAFRHGYVPRIFGWQPENFWKDVRIGGIAFLMVVPVILTIQLVVTQIVEYEHSTFDALKNNSGMMSIAITWFSAVFVAPVTEEIFFRGTLQAWLQRQDIVKDPIQIETIVGGWTLFPAKSAKRLEPLPAKSKHEENLSSQPVLVISDLKNSDRMLWLPVFVSAFIFAGIHLGQGPAPIPLFVFAFALGYIYRQTGSITICIVLHMLLNAFSMFVFTVLTVSEAAG